MNAVRLVRGALTAGAALAIIAGRPALADAADPALDQAAAEYNATKDNPDTKVVCHEEEVTGSRLTERVCRTEAQMRFDREKAKQFLDKPRPYVTQGQ